jgi:hypothetical protein
MADDQFQDLLDYCVGVPISALRHSAKVKLSHYLDSEGFVLNVHVIFREFLNHNITAIDYQHNTI